jgi:hypothetical protein
MQAHALHKSSGAFPPLLPLDILFMDVVMLPYTYRETYGLSRITEEHFRSVSNFYITNISGLKSCVV